MSVQRFPGVAAAVDDDGRADRHDEVAIEMLGGFDVRRGGRIVEPSQWRTGKNADLLRVLALNAGTPVSVARLTQLFWPDVERVRALASLRTAVCRLRSVLGQDRIERHPLGLCLRGVRVDTQEFLQSAATAQSLLAEGDTGSAGLAAVRAVMLYRGDLRTHDDAAEWAMEARADLARAHQRILCVAAETLFTLGRPGLAVDYAQRAVGLDPYCERSSRALMRAWSGHGENARALREYQRCQRQLGLELGVDPSPLTQQVYLNVLRAESDVLDPVSASA